MLMVISPAKKLDVTTQSKISGLACPEFLAQTEQLILQLKKLTPADLSRMMGISDKLAQLNVARFTQWQQPFTAENAKPALFTFSGDVYQGIEATALSKTAINYLQQHLRILSGLYGLLRPLDLMQPYRLEMGTKFAVAKHQDLYEFWKESLTHCINGLLETQKNPVLVNLASNEYFKVLDKTKLNGAIVTPVFKDWKSGQFKVISFFAKKARGAMVRFAAENKIKNVAVLKKFDGHGYGFDENLSTESHWVFCRKQQ